MDELTALQRDLLVVIAGATKPSGAEIRDQINDYYERAISDGGLYPNLNTLQEEGLIEKTTTPERRRNQYTLTEHGEDLLAEHAQWWNETATNDTILPNSPSFS